MVDFGRYHLRDNPFDPAVQSPFMADREEELTRLERSLNSAFSSKGTRFIVIQGTYGVGKTHMLNYIYDSFAGPASKQKGVFAVRNVLFERPIAVMETEPRWAKFGLSLVCRVFANIEKRRMQEVLTKISAENFSGAFDRLFVALREGDDAAFSYIAGEKLRAIELRTLGVRQILSDSPGGLNLFFEWLRLVGAAGYHTFLVLMDELEYIPQVLGETKVSQVLNTFREIFDRSTRQASDDTVTAKPVFVFAISPGGWDHLKGLERAAVRKTGGGGIAPFMERVSPRDTIDLGPFSEADTKELVSQRLAMFRIQETQNPLEPFAEDAVEYVHTASFNKPRNVIQYCGILLEDALIEGLERITGEDAARLLTKYGIAPPETSR